MIKVLNCTFTHTHLRFFRIPQQGAPFWVSEIQPRLKQQLHLEKYYHIKILNG